MTKNKIIIIAGPTASGKSGAAIKIAKKVNGEIIGADSMQIYKRMDIGTAKVTAAESDGVRHHMIDILEPYETFSVSEYAKMAEECIKDVLSRGKIPIVCGGTGLYIDSLIYDFGFGIEKDESLRIKLNERYDSDGGKEMYNRMMILDPIDTVKYHMNNKHRLIRAYEIYYLTGKTKSQLKSSDELKCDAETVIIDTDRRELYSNIDKRVDKMFEQGILNEIVSLSESGISFDMQSMQAIGYKEFADYFKGAVSIEEVKNIIKINTRHYAKRQMTWFKKYDFAFRMPLNKVISRFDNYSVDEKQ